MESMAIVASKKRVNEEVNVIQESQKRKYLSDAFTPKGTIKSRSYITISVVSFLLIFLVWWYECNLGGVNSMFLPSVASTFESAKHMFLKENFLCFLQSDLVEDEQQDGPHQVELLFDGQAPEVLEGRCGACRVEIRDVAEDLPPVVVEQQRRHDVRAHLVEQHVVEQRA